MQTHCASLPELILPNVTSRAINVCHGLVIRGTQGDNVSHENTSQDMKIVQALGTFWEGLI